MFPRASLCSWRQQLATLESVKMTKGPMFPGSYFPHFNICAHPRLYVPMLHIAYNRNMNKMFAYMITVKMPLDVNLSFELQTDACMCPCLNLSRKFMLIPGPYESALYRLYRLERSENWSFW